MKLLVFADKHETINALEENIQSGIVDIHRPIPTKCGQKLGFSVEIYSRQQRQSLSRNQFWS